MRNRFLFDEERSIQIRCPAPLLALPVPEALAKDTLRIYVPAVFSSATLDNWNGSWAYYDCPPGTISRGKQSFTQCLPNGTWSLIEMACLKLGCYAENVDFGHFEDFWTPAEGRPARIKCIEGAKFDNHLPRCIQKNDNSAGWEIPNKELKCHFTDMCQDRSFCGANGQCKTLMGNYTCECDRGYRFQANESAGQQCKAIDKCAEKLDLCSSAECETSQYSPTDYLCTCAENMTKFTEGLNRTLVIPNAEYLHPNRSCIRSRCPMPNLNSSFVIANESMLFLAGSRMKVYCKERTGVLANVSCLPDGNWDGEIPQYCHKTTCKSISLPNAATFIKHPLTTFAQQPTYFVDDIVSFRCYGQNASGESNLGYYLIGPEYILCLPSGEWNNPPPICVLPQCSAIDDSPPGGANVTRFSPNTPTGEKFAENTTIEFKCEGRNRSEIMLETIMCTKNRTNDGEFRMTWSVNTFPNCTAYLELNSTKHFRCDMKAEGDIRPGKKHLEEGEQANFTCIQPNYELSDPRPLKCTKYNSDLTRGSVRFSRLKRGTDDASDSQLSPGTISQDCIVTRHGKSTVFLGASVLLRCQLNSKCQNLQVRWVHQTSGVSLPTSFLHSSHVVSALIESVKISDQGKYVCEVLDQNESVLDRGSWIVDVLPDRKVRGWTEIISQTRPTTVVAMDSAKRLSGWSASVHWAQVRDGSWLYTPNRFSKNRLITPMVEVRTDWLGISVDLADCRDCLVWLSYYSTDSNVDAQKLPLDRFSTLGGATVDPNSHSIQFVLPFSKVWILITVDSGSASSSFRIKNLRFTVTACARIQLGMTIFPETTVSPKNKTVSGTCTSQHSIMPSTSGLKCSPTGVWYIDEENPPACVCEAGYVEYLGGCVSRGPLCYSCANSLQVNCTRFANAQYCSEGEVCQSVSRFSANEDAGTVGFVEKKCVPEEVCTNTFAGSTKQCKSGLEECSYCCSTDYCNWEPSSVTRPMTTTSTTTTTTTSTSTEPSTILPSTTPARRVNQIFNFSTTPFHIILPQQPLQVGEIIPVRFGLSSALPYCVDRQQMRLTCDPIIKVRRLGRFFYEPTRIKWPTVVDNDPNFAISSNLRPELMTSKIPLYPFDGSEKDILWVAVDKHGASATCITKVVFEDVLSPELLCPDLYVDDVYGSTGTHVPIRLPSDLIQFQDDTSQSTKLRITVNPPNGSFIEIDKPVMINVTTIDENSNQAQCQFWYQAVVKDCPLWQIDMEEYTCTNRSQLNDQIVACYRKRLCDGDRRQLPENFKALICIPGQDGWRLLQEGAGSHNAFLSQQKPTCLEYMSSTVTLSVGFGVVNSTMGCATEISQVMRHEMDVFLAAECTSVLWNFNVSAISDSSVTLNFTTDHRNTVDVLTCIRRITTATLATRNLPKLPPICQSKVRSHTILYHLLCPQGWGANRNLKCEKCPAGYYVNNESCAVCPRGSYSFAGSDKCSPCPEGSSTISTATITEQNCISFCSPGYFSSSGLAPCHKCPRGSFQSNFGQKSCFQCSFDMTTLYAGAKSAMECSKECEAGHFLFGKKCMLCPRGFFQQNPNEKFCQRCPSGTTTLEEGAKSFLQCAVISRSCIQSRCSEKGICLPNGMCKCQPGFAGVDCSMPIDLCNTAYCLNSGTCEFNTNGSSCRCPTGYTGVRCEGPIVDCESIPMHPFCLSSVHSKLRLKYPSVNQTDSENEESIGYYCNVINTTNACPNGQCYQNGTCLCNIGFEMQYFDANRTACVPKDPCAKSLCLNGATCRPLPDESTSAFACDCIPTLYTGPFCQYSLRRCSKAKPCENGGICIFENVSKIDYNDPNNSGPIEYYDSSTDSDSSEDDNESRRIYWPVCICPPGFAGLFCESNVTDEQNPCKYGNSLCNHNGECRQYSNSTDFYCECHSGYFGEFCEASFSSCSPEVEGSLQCMNGGTCSSLGPPYNSSTECDICENGLRPNASCSCPFGWTGNRCEIQKNHCLSWECKNGGTCVSLFSSAHCNCGPGFTGQHCETQIEPCQKVPHGDKWICGGQHINCSSNSIAGYNSPYKCYCAPGWNESYSCMRSVNSCNADDSSTDATSSTQKPKPKCNGKGTCLPIAGDSQNYLCACNSGRYGSTCEKPVNYCDLNICMNNGLCSNVMDENYSTMGYKCDCSSTGYTGLNCEAVEPPDDPCTPNPCQNNGKCTWHRDNNTIECNCIAGYNKADNCTTKSSECDKPNYCNNGTCMTFNDTNYVYCNCPAQQTGVRCEIRKNQNFNLYFTGAPSPVVQRIMSEPFGMQKMVNNGFSLCGWVKYGADSLNSDETQRPKPDTPFMTIMTLGKRMVPIISLSDRHVIFPDVITLNYTLSYRMWHHFCLVFNSSTDESSKTYMEVKFYVDGTIINVFGILPPSNLNETTKAVILLGQSANESNPEPFVGEMSLIQLFNEAVSQKSIESMLRDCRLWVRKPEIDVEVGWTDYTIIDMYNAAVMAIYPGICVTATCRPNRADCSADLDKTPPEVIRCPSDQFIVLNNGSRLVEVYWDGSLENMFRDNSGIITQFVSNFRPGQSFGWGEYHVVYIARDTAGNMATCQFKVTVSPQVCSLPIHEPTFTLVSITQLDSPFASQFAVAECHSEDYVFNNPKPPFYTCDVMGRWDRFTSLGASFNLPSCSPTDHPKQDLQGKVEFNGSCSDASNYGAKVRECLLNASKEFGGFCNTDDCADQINVDEHCEQLSQKGLLEKFFPGNVRPMREAGDDERQTIISVEYTLIVNNTKNPVETVVREQMTSTFGSSFKGVQSQLSCSDTFPLLHVTNVSRRIERGGSTVLEAMQTKTWMQTVIQCSACAAGEQWEQTDSGNGTCVKCLADTFKTDQGPGPCTPCPSDRITGNVTGCIREIDCYKNCTPGYVYDYTTDQCKPCPKGQFMPYYGHLMCFSCPADHTTQSTGSRRLEDCSVTCGAGEEMLSTEECSKCVQGTYRSIEMSRCVQCDLGFCTADSGSSSPVDCNQIYCPVGFYRSPDILDVQINQNEGSFIKVCIACDLGFYQSQLNSTSCEKCPDRKTTANTGSRSIEECDLDVDLSCVPNIPNQCPEGMDCGQTDTSGYECMVVFGSPTQTQPNTPLWVLVATGGSALLFAGGIVFLVVIYRKRWMLLYYRYCPSWLMCFKKMTVNDISGNDYSRDWTNVPMTLESTDVPSSGDISEPISVRETADWPERDIVRNGSSVADRINERKGSAPNADRIILGTKKDENKNKEGSMRGRSVTNILDGFDKRRQNRGSVRSSGSSVRSKSTPSDSDTASETRSIEDPLKEIRSTLLEFLAPDITQTAPLPAKRAETPPPVPQAHLTVQTSMQRNDQHATSFNARQSGNAHRFNMYADSSVSQAHQFHTASTGVGSRAMFTTTGSYAHASNAVGRRILTTTLSGEDEELDPLYRYRRKSDSNNKPMLRRRPLEDDKQPDQQEESAGFRTGPNSPLSLRNFPKDSVVPPSTYASRNVSVSPRSRPSHISQEQNTAQMQMSPNYGRGDMGNSNGHINEQKGRYPESFTPIRATPSTIGVRPNRNTAAPPSYDDDDDAFFS